MLNFILGRAGTGKTQTVRQMLVDRAALGLKFQPRPTDRDARGRAGARAL